MSGDLTLALGQLLADPVLRESLRRDPAGVSRALGVDLPSLLQIDVRGLDQQAEALIDKRFLEVSRRLPRTVTLLEGVARELFRGYAPRSWPRGQDRHVRDAAAFVAFLEERKLPFNRAEAQRVRFASATSRIRVLYAPDVWVGGRSRRALQVLVRFGPSVGSWVLYLGL